MIKATKEPIPEIRASALRAWLKKPEFETLKIVLQGKGKIASVNALEKALQSSEFAMKMIDANENDLRQAQRYATALDVLEEIVSEKESFTTVKLT